MTTRDRLDVHLYVHVSSDAAESALAQKVDQILAHLTEGFTHMAHELDDLTSQVKSNTDAEQSAIALINGIADRIAAAGTDPAKLTALTTSLKSSSDSLAAAVLANTPTA